MERDKFGRFVIGHKAYKNFKPDAKYHQHDGLAFHAKTVRHNGSHRTLDYKNKISKTVFKLWKKKDYVAKHSGANNPNWRGGAMNYYKTASWRMRARLRVWANRIKKRDKRCILCGSIKQLEADHIKPVSLHPDLALDLNNGRTLCFNCHVNTNTYGKKIKK